MTRALSEIIERVEGATGPSRELDAVILKALYPEAIIEFYCAGDSEPVVFHAEPLVRNKGEVPQFSASLDAALALVSEGAGIDLRRYWIARSESPVWSCTLYWGNGHSCDTEDRPSAALAVCLVSLRARLATQEQQG